MATTTTSVMDMNALFTRPELVDAFMDGFNEHEHYWHSSSSSSLEQSPRLTTDVLNILDALPSVQTQAQAQAQKSIGEEEEEEEEDDAMALLAASKARMAEIAQDQAKQEELQQKDNPVDETIEAYDDDDEDVADPQDGTNEDTEKNATEDDEEVHTSLKNDVRTTSPNDTNANTNTKPNTNDKPASAPSEPEPEVVPVETKEEKRARESIQLAEEAALLLAASKARLATPTALVDTKSKEVVTEIKPLEDDEEIESVHDDDDDDDDDDDSNEDSTVASDEDNKNMNQDHLQNEANIGEGEEGIELPISENDGTSNQALNSNDKHDNDEEDDNFEDEDDEEDDDDASELNEEEMRASEEARAYAAAMLTVADVSEKHNSRRVSYGQLPSQQSDDPTKKRSSSNGSSTSNGQQQSSFTSNTPPRPKKEERKSSGLMGLIGLEAPAPVKEESEDEDDAIASGATYIDKKYMANMEHLPPHLINALLHEEAMLAAEKAALEGKDRHVFNISEAAELSAEVQETKLKHLRDKAERSNNSNKSLGIVANIRRWFKEQREALKIAALEQEKQRQRQIVNDRLGGDQVRLKWRESSESIGSVSNSNRDNVNNVVAPSNISTDLATVSPGSPSNASVPEINIVREKIPEGNSDFIPYILTRTQMQSIAASGLPTSVKWCRWKRCYSLARDGDSFDTMLRLVKSHEKTLLVIRSTTGAIFGGYADSTWQSPLQAGNTFYGTGQAMLYRIMDDNQVKIYKWSGMNRYIQLCDTTDKRIAMGGGGTGGNFGLCVEEDFSRGSTGRCQTFENEPLCEGGEFDVLDFEVYGFLSYKF
uniref:Oxidation resistance protein 1 n=1 Tax=Leptocylindrus danicus TaxID=163516 RepID=A0A7S2NUQ3_9STRA|mmetsp:Transcript_12917/g.19351  ORF Transcript_12917/g.19351 Transcript_12917/m.19351 type:complete len:824 (+) Transcript_12917:125-2596(+)